MELSTPAASLKLIQGTSLDLPSATSSPASADGAAPSNWPAGLQLDLFGPDPAPASPSASPARGSALPTSGTFGPSSAPLSPSAALQSSLESRLCQRLAGYGSAEYSLTWKHWAMPARAPICALRASARRTSGSGCTGWRTVEMLGWNTPGATDGSNGGPNQANGALSADAALAGWQSPIASEARQGFQDRSRGRNGTQESLTTQAKLQLPPPESCRRLVYSQFAGLEGHPGHEHGGDKPGWLTAEQGRSIAAASAIGFWNRFDLLLCRDAHARRVEPGTFPLAHGVPGRVGLLRGYGNAIVPPLAAEFIQACAEAMRATA